MFACYGEYTEQTTSTWPFSNTEKAQKSTNKLVTIVHTASVYQIQKGQKQNCSRITYYCRSHSDISLGCHPTFAFISLEFILINSNDYAVIYGNGKFT